MSPTRPATEPTLTLEASNLFANWGFGDGEILSNSEAYDLAAAGLPIELQPHDVLIALVDRFLVPALPRQLPMDRYGFVMANPLPVEDRSFTMHNPIRVDKDAMSSEAYQAARAEVEGIEVQVSVSQISQVLRDLIDAGAGPRGGGAAGNVSGAARGTSAPPRRVTSRQKRAVPRAARAMSGPSLVPRTGDASVLPADGAPRQAALPFRHELIIDNFAGGGGTSEGLEQAFGRPVDIAINHDPQALAMHALNHPHTLHLCESVWNVKPIEVTKNQPVALVWLSPDCKHFSKAKGSTPVSKKIRGLAWVGMRWIATTKPRCLMLENVEEFQTWGPLKLVSKDGADVWMPDPKKKGVTFQSFVRQLERHGYKVEWRELRACDNGAPTIRKRLFLIARRDGLPIVWPDQTHADPTSRDVIAGNLQPYRTAAECIDFDLPAESIFERKKALVNNTKRRVAKGIWRHVLTNPSRFIVGCGGRKGQTITSKADACPATPVLTPFMVNTRNGERPGQDPRVRGVDEPYWTVTSQGSQGALSQPVLAPFLAGAGGPGYAGKPVSMDQPFGTLTTENHRVVVAPELMPVTTPFLTEHANSSNQRTMAADEPLRTICAQVKGGHFSVVEPKMTPFDLQGAMTGPPAGGDNNDALMAPVIAPLRGTEESHLAGDDIQEPLSTISAGGTHHAMAAMHLTKFRTGSSGAILDEPMPTVTANSFIKRPGGAAPIGLVEAKLVDSGLQVPFVAGLAHGARPDGSDSGDRSHTLGEPMRTIHAGGGNQAFFSAHLTHLTHHGERSGYRVDEPFKTITGAHRGEQAVVAACLEQAYGGFYEGNPGRNVDAPISTIMSKGANQRLISAYMEQANGGFYHGEGRAADVPMGTVCASGSKKQLVTAYMVRYDGAETPARGRSKSTEGDVRCVQVPLDSLDEVHRERAKACAMLLHEHLPEEFPEPAEMVLVYEDGGWWVLVDITLRMLKPRELFNAQGFPGTYKIDEIPDPSKLFVNGVQVANPLDVPRIPLTATAQVRMCGNSVSPYQSAALARANFGHELLINREAA
jgi:DNA (cytosine-5)-methyltransferase 1